MTAKLILEGDSIHGDRLITVEITPGSNLFKEDDLILPLFNGWSRATGDVLNADQRPFFRVARHQKNESAKDYVSRLNEVAVKISKLNQWHLTMRSRTTDEDDVIMDQILWLNNLPSHEYSNLTKLPFLS